MIKLFKERGSVSLCKLIFLFCVVLNLVMPVYASAVSRCVDLPATSLYLNFAGVGRAVVGYDFEG